MIKINYSILPADIKYIKNFLRKDTSYRFGINRTNQNNSKDELWFVLNPLLPGFKEEKYKFGGFQSDDIKFQDECYKYVFGKYPKKLGDEFDSRKWSSISHFPRDKFFGKLKKSSFKEDFPEQPVNMFIVEDVTQDNIEDKLIELKKIYEDKV